MSNKQKSSLKDKFRARVTPGLMFEHELDFDCSKTESTFAFEASPTFAAAANVSTLHVVDERLINAAITHLDKSRLV